MTTRAILLFDIDGTLVLTGGCGGRALNRIFLERYGIDDAFGGIKPHGMTDPAILREIIETRLGRDPEPGEMASILDAYVPLLAHELNTASTFRVLPGVAPLFERLTADPSIALGLATGNVEEAANWKTKRAGLEGVFTFGGFGSDAECREALTIRAVERGREIGGADAPVFVIGDTVRDASCAVRAGAACVAVQTTGASEADLRAAGAAHVVKDLTDAERLLDIFGL